MNAYLPCILRNLASIYLRCKDGFLAALCSSNTRMYHNERNFLFLQLYKSHTLHNEKSSFSHNHYRIDCKQHKNTPQTQFHTYYSSSPVAAHSHTRCTSPASPPSCRTNDSFSGPSPGNIWHHHGTIYMAKTLCIQSTASSTFFCSAYSQI